MTTRAAKKAHASNANVTLTGVSSTDETNSALLEEEHVPIHSIHQSEDINPTIRMLFHAAHGGERGHGGFDRTLSKMEAILSQQQSEGSLQEFHITFTHKSQVKRLLRLCPQCQRFSQIRVPITTKQFTNSTYHPWYRVQIDTITSLPKDSKGNTAIVVIIDCFSRYITLYPVKQVNAQAGCDAILDLMKHFPSPAEIISDNGVENTSIQVEELIAMLSVHHQTIQPGSHEENGIAERANKEVLRHLRTIVYDKRIRDEWSIALPFVQRIINAERHSATKVAPYEIVFGAIAPLDPLILRPFNRKDLFEKGTMSAWSANMLKIQHMVSTVARESLTTHDNYTMRHPATSITSFPINSYVWKLHGRADERHKPPTKLHATWEGPFRVLGVSKDGNEYHLVHASSGVYAYSHVKLLKEFLWEEGIIDPAFIALGDNQARIVEKILRFSCKRNKQGTILKRTLRFLVKLSGVQEPEWFVYDDLRNNEVLHTYLREEGLDELIPDYHNTL